jgi:hypothetical protein
VTPRLLVAVKPGADGGVGQSFPQWPNADAATEAYWEGRDRPSNQRPDIVYRPVTGLSGSTVVVAWPESARSPVIAAFVRAATEYALAEDNTVLSALDS